MKHIRKAICDVWQQRFIDLDTARASDLQPISIPICRCASTKLRRRTIANGSLTFAEQCLRCGNAVGNCIKRDTINAPDELEEWDDSLSKDWDQRRDTIRRDARRVQATAQEQGQREWRELYDRYRASSEWKAKRNKVIAREAGQCQGCLDNRISQVHHVTYDRVGCELLIDLVGLCADCHTRVHGREVA